MSIQLLPRLLPFTSVTHLPSFFASSLVLTVLMTLLSSSALWISIPNKVGQVAPLLGTLPTERQLTGQVSGGRVPRHQGLLR